VATMSFSRFLKAGLFLTAWVTVLPEMGLAPGISVAHAAGGHGPYTIWSDLPFWAFIGFLGFLFAVYKLGLWDLLLRSMATRESAERQAIDIAEGDLGAAQTVLRQAKGRLESLDETVREILNEAQRDVTTTKTDILEVANREAKNSIQRAKLEIDRARDQALLDIFSNLSDKVTATAAERLRNGLTAEDHHRLISESLANSSIH
jgi:F-type H+-transporting ATPase subunit b